MAGTPRPFLGSRLFFAFSLTMTPSFTWVFLDHLTLPFSSSIPTPQLSLHLSSFPPGLSSAEGLGLWDLSPVLLQAELDSRADSISLARSTGQRLLAAGHPSTRNISQALAGLDQELNSLEEAWQEHQLQLQQALELQVGSLHPDPTYWGLH